MSNHEAKITELSGSLAAKTSEAASLSSDLKQTQNANGSLTTAGAGLDTCKASLRRETAKIAGLESELRGKAGQIRTLKGRVKTCDSERSSLRSQLGGKETLLSRCQNES